MADEKKTYSKVPFPEFDEKSLDELGLSLSQNGISFVPDANGVLSVSIHGRTFFCEPMVIQAAIIKYLVGFSGVIATPALYGQDTAEG